MVKLPDLPDLARLADVGSAADEVALAPHTVLWRIHDAAAQHARPWNALRFYGPIGDSRFDPHDPPSRAQPEGVTYVALDIATAVAERFQQHRVVNRNRNSPHLVGFRPQRALRLLDLTDTWPIRAGASHVLNTGPHATCRAWAVAIRSTWPMLDGLWYSSSMTGRPCVVLWTPAIDAIPADAEVLTPVASPALDLVLRRACDEIGYQLV